MDRKAGAKKISQRNCKLLGVGFDREMASGPWALRRARPSDTKSACVDERIRFHLSFVTAGRRIDTDGRLAPPCSRSAAGLLECSANDFAELGGDIQERRQRETAVLELRMGHAKPGGLVRAALIPKQVEIDTARAPSFVRPAMATETTFRSQQHMQELPW